MILGLVGGVGNIDFFGIGVVFGVFLKFYDIFGYFYISVVLSLQVSEGFVFIFFFFGEGCGGVYIFIFCDIDKQVYDNGYLLYFFFVGNSVFFVCSFVYGVLVKNNFRYGNIIGGCKFGKNVFVVANLFYDDNWVVLSSCGFVVDGCIKFDISVYGQGNYFICLNNSYGLGGGIFVVFFFLVGMVVFLVYVYCSLNNNQDFIVVLIKGVLLNIVDDFGNFGFDYDFGWGWVYVGWVFEVIDNEQYIEVFVSNGFFNLYSVFVLVNVKEVWIMIYWIDVEGFIVVVKALVNDFDFLVVILGGQV